MNGHAVLDIDTGEMLDIYDTFPPARDACIRINKEGGNCIVAHVYPSVDSLDPEAKEN